MRIRSAEPTDLPALAAVAAETFPLACPPHLAPDDIEAFVAAHLSAERFADYLKDQARLVLVAEADDGQLLGYCMSVSGEPRDCDVAQIVKRRPTVELSKC